MANYTQGPFIASIQGDAYNGSTPVDVNWYLWNSDGSLVGSGSGTADTWNDQPWGNYVVGCQLPGGDIQKQNINTWNVFGLQTVNFQV